MLDASSQSSRQSVLVDCASSARAKQLVANEESMSKAKDEIRPEYRREELGRGVRGKYHARVSRGTNLVILNEEVAKAFPSSEAVNEALRTLVRLTRTNVAKMDSTG